MDSRFDVACQRSSLLPCSPGHACGCILSARTGKIRKREKKELFIPWRTVVGSLYYISSCSLPLLCFHHSHLELFCFLNYLLVSPGISSPRNSKDFFHKHLPEHSYHHAPSVLVVPHNLMKAIPRHGSQGVFITWLRN